MNNVCKHGLDIEFHCQACDDWFYSPYSNKPKENESENPEAEFEYQAQIQEQNKD